MRINKLKERMNPKRPMTAISIRVPEDVIEDLRRVAEVRGFSGYQPLMRAYVGQGLRQDLALLEEQPSVDAVVKKLQEHGVANKVIKKAVAEARLEKRSA